MLLCQLVVDIFCTIQLAKKSSRRDEYEVVAGTSILHEEEALRVDGLDYSVIKNRHGDRPRAFSVHCTRRCT